MSNPTPSPFVKLGRKQKHHVTSWGETVVGLSRRPDGRWRVIGTHTTFREPDERKAVAKFRALQRGENEPTVALQFHAVAVTPVMALKPITGPDGKPTHDTGNVVAEASEAELFAWFAEQIRTRPEYVAAQTGIEQLAYLDRVQPPTPLPSFAEIEKTWQDHFNKSAEQKRKVIAAWRDFVETAQVAGLRDIQPQAVIAYRDAVWARKTTGKSQQNLFTRIRRLLSFAKSRAIAVEEMSRCLSVLSLLTPSETTVSLDPRPIESEDFQALLAKAHGDDKAMILCALNFGMYLAEVIALKWANIKGDYLVSHRAKTGRCVRVAALWKETKDALVKVERRGEYIFYNYKGQPLGIKGAEQRFRKVREAAKVQVTSSQLRDGALTAAAQANVDERTCRLLAGHSCGIQDRYVKRNPSMVAPACEAVYAAYFAPVVKLVQGDRSRLSA